MSLKLTKAIPVFLGSLVFSSQLIAQNIDRPFENLPYSRYGLGEEMNTLNPALKSMGGISAGYSDEYFINTDNPASYASLKYMTYEASFEGRKRTLSTNTEKYQTGNASLASFTLGIPMGKYLGAAIGFRPSTKVGYSLYDTLTTSIGPTSYSYNGKGGTNQAFIGFAGKYKGFSLGANVGYTFGRINQSSWFKTTTIDHSVNNSEFLKSTVIGGFSYTASAMYENNFYKSYVLKVGVQGSLKQNINSKINEYWISHPFWAADTTAADTAFSKQNAKGIITLPSTYTFGAHLSNGDRWTIGVNYKTTNWKEYQNQGIPDSIANSTYRISIGGEYTPDVISFYKYWNRVTYRAGFYYGNDFVSINGVQANVYAGTVGLSLPFKRSTDRIHLGLEMGKWGNKNTTSLQQNFFKLSIGVSFNDKSWFIKRKYD
jgi:hypothetical protein